jgi:hypothetical protein
VWNAINKAVRISIAPALGFYLGMALTHSGDWNGRTVFTLGATAVSRAALCIAVFVGLVFLSIWTDQQARHETWDREYAEAVAKTYAAAEAEGEER